MPTNCLAVSERKRLTQSIHRANNPLAPPMPDLQGTESEMIAAFSVLEGIVNEYKDGGDQMVENCTCGAHIDKEE